ncbi:hypothetical protein AA313_de0204055 [Arthrobotrys entomopaga]|nr:hypothetical protein AA313_de0204055 [Arthrobotrys entomopaga]
MVRPIDEAPAPLLDNGNLKSSPGPNYTNFYPPSVSWTNCPPGYQPSNMSVPQPTLTAGSQFDRANFPPWHLAFKHDIVYQEPHNPTSNLLIKKLPIPNRPTPRTESMTDPRKPDTQPYTPMSAQIDDTAELNNLTRLWLNSHVASLGDAMKHMPLEELGKQPIAIGRSFTLPQRKDGSWNLVKIENVGFEYPSEQGTPEN